jgi:hypothetical protein
MQTRAPSANELISMFLYLTTTGRRTGVAREIEIWFTELGGHFYIIAEHGERATWVETSRLIRTSTSAWATGGSKQPRRSLRTSENQNSRGPSRRYRTSSMVGAMD